MVEKSIAWESTVRGDILRHLQELSFHFESRANWLTSLSAVILVLIVSNFDKFTLHKLSIIGVSIIITGCIFAIINFMFILIPRLRIMKSNKTKTWREEVFSYGNITQNYTPEQLINYLSKLRKDSKELDKAFGSTIHRLASIRLPFIVRRLKIGGWAFIVSLVVGLILIIIGFANI